MAKEDKKPYSDKVELKGRLSEFRKALEEEIEAIESNGQNSIVLTNGKRIEGYGKKKIEQIRLENERTNAEIKRKEDELSRNCLYLPFSSYIHLPARPNSHEM